MCSAGSPDPSILAISRSAATLPISYTGWSTTVTGGVVTVVQSALKKEMIEMSPGTDIPNDCSDRSTCKPTRLSDARMAVGG